MYTRPTAIRDGMFRPRSMAASRTACSVQSPCSDLATSAAEARAVEKSFFDQLAD